MTSVYYRIDDRLIHGQVITAWSRYYHLDAIFIVDDGVASDLIQQRILTAVAPKDVDLRILTVEQGAAVLSEAGHDDRPTLVLAKGPETLVGLQGMGIPIPEAIVGGIQFKPGRKQLTRTVSVTDDEVASFRELAREGTRLILQVIPSDRQQELLSVINRAFPEGGQL